MRIGEMLLARGHIDQHQLASALAYQKHSGGRLGRALVSMGFVTESKLLSTLAVQLSVPVVHIGDRTVPASVWRLVPEKLLRSRRVFPLEILSASKRGALLVALSEPDNLSLLDEIAFVAGRAVQPALAAEADIDRALARHLEPEDRRDEPKSLEERRKLPRTYS
jgi:type IV pilus assembly protein PilB